MKIQDGSSGVPFEERNAICIQVFALEILDTNHPLRIFSDFVVSCFQILTFLKYDHLSEKTTMITLRNLLCTRLS